MRKRINFYVDGNIKHSRLAHPKEIKVFVESWLKLYPPGKHIIYYDIIHAIL